MTETIRAFIAIPIPAPVRACIGGVQTGIRRHGFKMRWVRPESVHLTLKFLGDIPVSDIDRVRPVMGDAAYVFSPFTLCAKGAGVFPGIQRPRVLWVGLGGEVTFGPVTPFLDVIGAVQWTSADLSVGGQIRTWDATGFGFATRAGARVDIRDWFFVQASGEVGLVGDVTWSAALSVGFGVD